MIHQLMPSLSSNDAIGNYALTLRRIFQGWGMAGSEIFSAARDRRVRDPGRAVTELRLAPDDWLIYHYGNGSPLSDLALTHPSKLIFCYHNVTPGRFFAPFSVTEADRLDQGRTEIFRFKSAATVTDSAYNQAELLDLGFFDTRIAPLRVDAQGLRRSAELPAGKAVVAQYPRTIEGNAWVNWLFVGRVAPNKRQDMLICAFSDYQRWQPNSRLLLVGTWHVCPGYKAELDYLVRRLGVQNVIFAGQPSYEQGFGAYYAAADVYISASEHEGFGVPLVEAMAFGLPVVARTCGGVACAVGDGGLLVDRAGPEALAEGARILLEDAAVRAFYAAGQPARVAAHDLAAVSAAWRDALTAFEAVRRDT